jgi:hypothetical protein
MFVMSSPSPEKSSEGFVRAVAARQDQRHIDRTPLGGVEPRVGRKGAIELEPGSQLRRSSISFYIASHIGVADSTVIEGCRY